jgi:hypothetical protein
MPAPSVLAAASETTQPSAEDLIKQELAKIDHMPCMDAFGNLRPRMRDAVNEDDDATSLFALYAARRLRWRDVYVAADETTFGKVQKDSDQERGRRMCISGGIVQIKNTEAIGGKLAEGLLLSSGGHVYRFFAAASTGDLVERSDARFCGIVTGLYDYSNSGGGTSHAVTLVGMFDLPENRRLGAGTPPTHSETQGSAQQAATGEVCPAGWKWATDYGVGETPTRRKWLDEHGYPNCHAPTDLLK